MDRLQIAAAFFLGCSSMAITASSPGAPVIFLPGYSGCTLYATIAEGKFVPETCKGIVPVGQPFSVIYNATLLALSPKCIYDLMRTSFDAETNMFSSVQGVTVSVQNFGDFSGFSPVYLSFPKQLQAWGYKVGLNAFGAPYDYRFMSTVTLTASGFVSDLKDLVEKAYNQNNRSPVVLIGHSNGGPTLYYFFDLLGEEWKATYIAAMIGLSGNFLGQMNGIKPFVDPDETGEKEMTNSWEAQYMSFTAGNYDAAAETTVVTSFAGDSEREKRYTPKKADIIALLEVTGRSDWLSRYKVAQDRMNRSAHPGVDTFCFYGSNVSTSYGFVFEGEVGAEASVATLMMDGDGNQDIVDNEMCQFWKATAGAHVTETKAFPGVRHMEMYSDAAVLAEVFSVLQRNNKQ